jgi:hypothetical protein
VAKQGFNTRTLPRPIPVMLADGKPSSEGPITKMVTLRLQIGHHSERIDFAITDLGTEPIFLRHDWLKEHNLNIDWQTGTLEFDRCPAACQPTHVRALTPDEEGELIEWLTRPDEALLMVDMEEQLQIRASSTHSTRLASEAAQREPKLDFEQVVPAYLHEYQDVFDKKDFDELPPS